MLLLIFSSLIANLGPIIAHFSFCKMFDFIAYFQTVIAYNQCASFWSAIYLLFIFDLVLLDTFLSVIFYVLFVITVELSLLIFIHSLLISDLSFTYCLSLIAYFWYIIAEFYFSNSLYVLFVIAYFQTAFFVLNHCLFLIGHCSSLIYYGLC